LIIGVAFVDAHTEGGPYSQLFALYTGIKS
jgi:hypothetical protein